MQINIADQLKVDVNPKQDSLCFGSTVLHRAMGPGGTGQYGYRWRDDNNTLLYGNGKVYRWGRA
jgi:hypothetical protein